MCLFCSVGCNFKISAYLLQQVDKDIEEFSNALNRLKEQREKIQSLLKEETEEGYEYKLKHIDKLDYDHRIVGTKGLRLKVSEQRTKQIKSTTRLGGISVAVTEYVFKQILLPEMGYM